MQAHKLLLSINRLSLKLSLSTMQIMWFLMELSSIGPALSRLGSDSSRGAEVEAGGGG